MDIDESLEFATKLIEHQYSIANVKIIRQFASGPPLLELLDKNGLVYSFKFLPCIV